MVRYEGAALILAAFVMDMIHQRKQTRANSGLFCIRYLATVPLALWLLGTFLTWKPGTTHYFEVLFSKEYAEGFAQPVKDRTGILLHIRLLWMVGFRPLLMPYPGAGEAFIEMLWKLSKTLHCRLFLRLYLWFMQTPVGNPGSAVILCAVFLCCTHSTLILSAISFHHFLDSDY